MKKYYLYNKKNNRVKMESSKPFKNYNKDIMAMTSKQLTNAEKEKLDKNYKMQYKNKLKFIKPRYIIQFENTKKLKEEIDKANSVEKLKGIIKKLI